MVQTKSSLAWGHQFPPPLPDDIDADRTVMVRYDGVRIEGENVVFAVMDQEDISRLPADVLDGIEFDGTSDAFFVGTESDLRLYVDTEMYPDFVDTVRKGAEAAGLTMLHGAGDLQEMRGPDGDIAAPEVPAFVENGMGHVPARLALSFVQNNRPQAPDAGPAPV